MLGLLNIFSRPGQSQSVRQSVSEPFPPTALWRRQAQTIRDSTSSYKIDYVIMIKNFLNPEGHQSPFSGSSYGHFTEGVDLAYWWSLSGGGSALQPAQQACLNEYYKVKCHTEYSPVVSYKTGCLLNVGSLNFHHM